MSGAASALSRSDRRVIHARLRIDARAPRHSLIFNVEEALRLTSLPGEDQGRTYYFCHLRLDGLPEDGDRRVWVDAFQRSLLDQAKCAVHGLDASAENAVAVYFASEHEACQSLLSAISQRSPLQDAWFWSAISQAGSHDGPAVHAARIIERLAASPSSWLAVATAIFAADNPVHLLTLLQAETVRGWLIEMGMTEPPSMTAAVQPMPEPFPFSIAAQKVILDASTVLSRTEVENPDPRLLWLTSLAIILADPGEMNRRTAPASARRALAAMHVSEAARQDANASRNCQEITRAAALLSRGVGLTPQPEALSRAKDSSERQKPPASSTLRRQSLAPDPGADIASPIRGVTGSAPVSEPSSSRSDASLAAPSPFETLLGETLSAGELAVERTALGARTDNAGLYFLLNALTDLGIRDAESPIPFLARLFQLMAAGAGVAEHDPILHWTVLALEESPAQSVDERELRLWAWRVRKWCWRQARISLRDVVRRSGFVLLTRTDLDISLPLTSVDIRIRRVGLDLDPGWIAWFGRVVRFHYFSKQEISGGELI